MQHVYALVCTSNGLAYVGSTFDLKKRMNSHRYHLRNASHRSREMVADWHQYGESAFRLVVLESLPGDTDDFELRSAEWRWQKIFAMQGRLYVTERTKRLRGSGGLAAAEVQRCLAALQELEKQSGRSAAKSVHKSSACDEIIRPAGNDEPAEAADKEPR
jgi:hypothetical protein